MNTREAWLNAAVEKLRPLFNDLPATPAKAIHVLVS